MNQVHSRGPTLYDDALMCEVMRVSSLLGRYLMTLLDAGRTEPSVEDETALADRVASGARDMRARATRRGRSHRSMVSTVDIAGSPAEVLAVLQQPVRWEDES